MFGNCIGSTFSRTWFSLFLDGFVSLAFTTVLHGQDRKKNTEKEHFFHRPSLVISHFPLGGTGREPNKALSP